MEDNEQKSEFNDGYGLINDNIDNLRGNQLSAALEGGGSI